MFISVLCQMDVQLYFEQCTTGVIEKPITLPANVARKSEKSARLTRVWSKQDTAELKKIFQEEIDQEMKGEDAISKAAVIGKYIGCKQVKFDLNENMPV